MIVECQDEIFPKIPLEIKANGLVGSFTAVLNYDQGEIGIINDLAVVDRRGNWFSGPFA